MYFILHSSTNVTHTVVVRPLEGIRGRFNFTAGEITYLSEGSSEVQIGYTSEPGEGFIVSLKEFNKLFSPHYVSHNDLKISALSLTHSHTVRLGRIPAHFSLNGTLSLFPVEFKQKQVRGAECKEIKVKNLLVQSVLYFRSFCCCKIKYTFTLKFPVVCLLNVSRHDRFPETRK